MEGFSTIPEVAKLLGVTDARVRHALTKLDEPAPRAGAVGLYQLSGLAHYGTHWRTTADASPSQGYGYDLPLNN